MYTIIRVCILITALSSCFTISGKAREYDSTTFFHFTDNNGLPSDHVYCGLTDKLGNVWLGTEDGVVKYNGYSFKVFTTEDGLPNNDVWRLWQDSLDRIWVYTISSSLGYIKNDKYKSIDISIGSDVFRVGLEAANDTNTFFVATGTEFSFFVVNTNDSVIYQRSLADTFYRGMNSKIEVFESVINEDSRLHKLIFNGKELEYVDAYKDSMIKYAVYLSSCNFFDERMIGYSHAETPAAINIYDLETKIHRVKTISSYGGDDDEQIYVKMFYPYSYSFITNKAIYQYLDASFDSIKRFDYKKVLPTRSQVSFFLNDNYGNEWYMTEDDGVWIIPKHSTIFSDKYKVQALNRSIYVGDGYNGDSYWFSRSDRKLYVVDISGELKKTINTYRKKIVKVRPYSDSQLLASTYISFEVYDLQKGYWKSYSDVLNKMTGASGRAVIYNDSLIGTSLYNSNGWDWVEDSLLVTYGPSYVNVVGVKNGALLANIIGKGKFNGMLNDTFNKKYWVYNHSSLNVYDHNEETYNVFGTSILKVLGVSNIYSIQQDGRGIYYILSETGLIKYNSANGQLSRLRLNVDLKDARFSIHDKVLCVAGSFGVAYADISEQYSRLSFNIYPNVKGLHYKKVTSLFVNDSIALVSTDNGTYKVPLIKEGAKVISSPSSGLPFISINVATPSHHVLGFGDTLSFKQNIPSFNVGAVNIYGKGSLKLKYRIGEHGDWASSESGDIIIAGLKVDHYYTVYCELTDDLWSSGIYPFTIYRTPRWWQTQTWRTIFWVSGLLTLILLILVVVYITRRIVAKNNEKRQKLTDLELRAIYSQINPHFIFNTLSSVLFFIDKKDFDQAYKHVSKFSRLLRSYLKSSQERYVTITEEIKMLKNYIELQQSRFEDKFDYRIEVDNKIAADSIQIPSLLLQPLVENAINHGLFHKQGKGSLVVRFCQEKANELVCEIEDSGVGRAKAEEIKNESSTNRESYGTKLTQSLIAIFREYEKMNINLEYIDKSGDDTGTVVKLTIKNLKYVTGV